MQRFLSFIQRGKYHPSVSGSGFSLPHRKQQNQYINHNRRFAHSHSLSFRRNRIPLDQIKNKLWSSSSLVSMQNLCLSSSSLLERSHLKDKKLMKKKSSIEEKGNLFTNNGSVYRSSCFKVVTYFCIEEQGMETYDLLMQGSGSVIQLIERNEDSESSTYYLVTCSHVLQPYDYMLRCFGAEHTPEWLSYVKPNHVRVVISPEMDDPTYTSMAHHFEESIIHFPVRNQYDRKTIEMQESISASKFDYFPEVDACALKLSTKELDSICFDNNIKPIPFTVDHNFSNSNNEEKTFHRDDDLSILNDDCTDKLTVTGYPIVTDQSLDCVSGNEELLQYQEVCVSPIDPTKSSVIYSDDYKERFSGTSVYKYLKPTSEADTVYKGMSGGPIFNSSNQFAGIFVGIVKDSKNTESVQDKMSTDYTQIVSSSSDDLLVYLPSERFLETLLSSKEQETTTLKYIRT